MSFTYYLNSPEIDVQNIARARFELGDQVQDNGVLPSGGNLQDEEIAVYLALNGNDIDATVAALAGVLSRHWAGAADVSVGPRRESLSQIATQWAERAKATGSSGPGIAFFGRVRATNCA